MSSAPPDRLVADYRVVLDTVARTVSDVTATDVARPTPCGDWTFGELVGHVAGAIRYYALLARDGETDVRSVTVPIEPDDDVAAVVADAACVGLAAWSAPGVLDRTVTMRLGSMTGAGALAIHVADLAVHAWDLAVARGQSLELPADLAERCRATWSDVLARHDLRGIVFADEVHVPPDAGPTARLVAYCGRTP